MDPADYFIWQEFLDPGMEYECPSCGTPFGEENVASDEHGSRLYECPGCGRSGRIEDGEPRPFA